MRMLSHWGFVASLGTGHPVTQLDPSVHPTSTQIRARQSADVEGGRAAPLLRQLRKAMRVAIELEAPVAGVDEPVRDALGDAEERLVGEHGAGRSHVIHVADEALEPVVEV